MIEGRPAQRSWRYTLVSAALGVAAVVALLIIVNASTVVSQLSHAAVVLPIAFVLEAGVLACETYALWRLYGDQRHAIGFAEMLRAALIGYPSMVLLPAGRSVAEAVRASLLAKHTNWQRATSVAVEMQVVLLGAVSFISVLGAVGAWLVDAGNGLVIAIAVNAVLTGLLAFVTLTAARRTGIGAWLAARLRRLDSRDFGEFLRNRPPMPVSAVAAALVGRLLQLLEIGVLFFAVSGHVTIPTALAAEGIHMVGGSLGDLIPNQLGATDAAFTLAAQRLGIAAGGGLAIALLAHATQAAWAVIGAIVPLILANRPPLRTGAR